ncbi:amidohydrolase [Robiginitalea sp. M366]|uniref:amidohydrolase n=1 Tax=Robiginitalea aestuariiviva TaxID=3036903 RepID=UPI00240D42B9|nr:amidohydrolase [Robiginitalea aestuariiviva]MDG1572204.1 amidohydrolase [Robiginitalea aestuariiviva]
MKWTLTGVTALILMSACSEPRQEADLIVHHARVYTVGPEGATAEAFAVKDGRFVAVGTSEEILEAYSAPDTRDAAGQVIVPGLIDAHCHFYGLGLNQEAADLVGTRSFEEVLERVQAFHEAHPADYLYGRGWDQNDWEVKAFPDKAALDRLFPDIPVALERVDGHALLVNQKALDLGGITASTRVPGGEVILKDGQPTGILVDSPMDLVMNRWPAPDRAAQIRALQQAEQICFANGLTTVNDAGLSADVIGLIDSLQQAGELKIRVYAMVSNSPANLDAFLGNPPVKTDRLNVRSVKVYADGALGSRGAALKAPYTDQPGHFGAMITPAEDLDALARRIAAAGFQMNTHAIGDSANVAVLRAYRAALAGLDDPRWKVEHAQILDTADLKGFGPKILPSIQPTHATSDMYWAEDRLGADRMPGAYAFAKLLKASGRVALGTDFPVEQVNPMLTFYAAVARQDQEGYPEGGFQMEDALSREEALKGMTLWAAYSNFEEGEKGSIEPGKWADFTFLDADLMTVPASALKDIGVQATFVAGKQVY